MGRVAGKALALEEKPHWSASYPIESVAVEGGIQPESSESLPWTSMLAVQEEEEEEEGMEVAVDEERGDGCRRRWWSMQGRRRQ